VGWGRDLSQTSTPAFVRTLPNGYSDFMGGNTAGACRPLHPSIIEVKGRVEISHVWTVYLIRYLRRGFPRFCFQLLSLMKPVYTSFLNMLHTAPISVFLSPDWCLIRSTDHNEPPVCISSTPLLTYPLLDPDMFVKTRVFVKHNNWVIETSFS
jgi:hypothetical protein